MGCKRTNRLRRPLGQLAVRNLPVRLALALALEHLNQGLLWPGCGRRVRHRSGSFYEAESSSAAARQLGGRRPAGRRVVPGARGGHSGHYRRVGGRKRRNSGRGNGETCLVHRRIAGMARRTGPTLRGCRGVESTAKLLHEGRGACACACAACACACARASCATRRQQRCASGSQQV